MRRNGGTRSEQHRLERVEVSAALPADCGSRPATAAGPRKLPHTSGCGGTWDRLSKDASQNVRSLNHDMDNWPVAHLQQLLCTPFPLRVPHPCVFFARVGSDAACAI